MDKGVVVDIGNDIEGFVPVSQLFFGHKPQATSHKGRENLEAYWIVFPR